MTPRQPSQLRLRLAYPFILLTALGYSKHWRRVQFVGVWLTQTICGLDRIQHLDELGT